MEHLGLDVAKSALMTCLLLAMTLTGAMTCFVDQCMDMRFVLMEMSRLSIVT